MANGVKYKINRDNKIIILFTKFKKMLFSKNNRAFRMLKKGSSTREPIINSKVHRSIK